MCPKYVHPAENENSLLLDWIWKTRSPVFLGKSDTGDFLKKLVLQLSGVRYLISQDSAVYPGCNSFTTDFTKVPTYLPIMGPGETI